jgi:hypothetical protein
VVYSIDIKCFFEDVNMDMSLHHYWFQFNGAKTES